MKISKEVLIGSTICLFLSIGVILSIKFLTDTAQKIDIIEASKMGQYVAQRTSDSIHIEEPFKFDEIEKITKGDVIAIGKAHIKLNGTVTEQTDTQVKYKVNKGKSLATLFINRYAGNSDKFLKAVTKFLSGDIAPLMTMSGIQYDAQNLSGYQQTTPDGIFPVIYDAASQSYYVFYAYGKGYYVLYSTQPFNVTTEMVTAHYPGPSEDPLQYHEYSTYEVEAINNTRMQLSDGNYQPFEVIDTLDTPAPVDDYNTKAANTTRADMVAKTGINWSTDGTSEESTSTVDITSATALASKWVVGDSTYLFTDNGLTVSDLTYKANSSHVEISGKVTNTLASERPYVLLVKFLDENNNLIGIDGSDSRNEPIAPNGSSVFVIDVPSSTLNPKDVKALMFEVY